ncbi:MAG: NUDIX hydrolase [Deltaproteobacteria bacterium]|nr:NUDIX hydrolase [Deltaproteobacteria bacterium]
MAIPTWFFALVVVRDGDRFLLVHEKRHGQRWYLPAGRVEPGETLANAAVRETMEEAGLPIELLGILRVEHTPVPGGARMRVFYAARPIDERAPKSVPDDESLGAEWFTLNEIERLPLRGGAEVKRLLQEVVAGAPLHPLELIAPEGSPLIPGVFEDAAE